MRTVVRWWVSAEFRNGLRNAAILTDVSGCCAAMGELQQFASNGMVRGRTRKFGSSPCGLAASTAFSAAAWAGWSIRAAAHTSSSSVGGHMTRWAASSRASVDAKIVVTSRNPAAGTLTQWGQKPRRAFRKALTANLYTRRKSEAILGDAFIWGADRLRDASRMPATQQLP